MKNLFTSTTTFFSQLTIISLLVFQSKGYILAKACDYITELKGINEQLAFALKQQEHLSNDVEAMSRKLKDISQENDILKATLAQHGISLP